MFFTGRIVLLDVRPRSEFERAIHVPLAELRTTLEEIRGDRPVAFICRSGCRSA